MKSLWILVLFAGVVALAACGEVANPATSTTPSYL